MHELSIVMSVVDIANEEAIKAKVEAFSQIELKIGTQSGIEMDAFNFAWPIGVKDSVLENANLLVHYVQAISECSECGNKFEIENIYDSCPKCNSIFTEVIQGKELKISALSYEPLKD